MELKLDYIETRICYSIILCTLFYSNICYTNKTHGTNKKDTLTIFRWSSIMQWKMYQTDSLFNFYFTNGESPFIRLRCLKFFMLSCLILFLSFPARPFYFTVGVWLLYKILFAVVNRLLYWWMFTTTLPFSATFNKYPQLLTLISTESL